MTNERQFKTLVREAHAAGMAAAEAARPTPMVVEQRADIFNDTSAVVQSWNVPDGVCGFAWVHIKGNTAFGRWAKAQGIAGTTYGPGLDIRVHEHGQSLERKAAHARAYSKVLRDAGISAHSGSRID